MSSKRLHKGQHQNLENIPVKVHVHAIPKELLHSQGHFNLGLDWMFKKFKQISTSKLAKILMWRTLSPVKFQHDAK